MRNPSINACIFRTFNLRVTAVLPPIWRIIAFAPILHIIVIFVMNTSFCTRYPEIYNFVNSIPKPDCKFLYGTAGFRMNYELLPSVFIRVGIIGTLRSKYLKKVCF